MTELLAVREISKTFGSNKLPAVDTVSFDCRKGEVLAIVGGSGSGKTTLLRIIAGLEIPDSGEIVLDGEQINGPTNFLPPEKRDCTLVFQDYALFPNMTVEQNVFFAKAAKQRPEQVRKLLQLTKISDLAKRYPHEISGGEQQRVALVRALATQPSLLLLDEPLSHLDPELRDNVRAELINLFEETETTALFVSHDTEDAMAMADRVIVMRNGRAIQVGTPMEVYSKPSNRYAALLFGKTNLIPLNLIPDAPHSFQDERSQVEVVSIRPHDWQILQKESSDSSSAFSGIVKTVHYKGTHLEVVFESGAMQIIINAPIKDAIKEGEELAVAPKFD
jgi:iron(III) transport system ATP-binding protein